MSVNESRLRHINLQQNRQMTLLRESLYNALVKAVEECKGESGVCNVLDVGVGRGELLRSLQMRGYATHGVDLEAGCVDVAGSFGVCRQGGLEDVTHVFPEVTFDVVVCSHVLEHLDNPYSALKKLAELGASGYVFAVPNPLRPVRIIHNIFRSYRADHPEHVHAWAHPEFLSLLNRCGFSVDSWYTDRVTINPFRGRTGKIITHLLTPVESGILPRLFPMLSSSLIVRCHVEKRSL